jgi:hypothetical protein
MGRSMADGLAERNACIDTLGATYTALLSIRTSKGPVLTSRYARVVYVTILGPAACVVTILSNQPAPGIVYKSF